MSTYIDRDVQPYYRLEKVSHFRDFIFLLASRAGQTLNYQSLARDLGVSLSAVRLWTKILEVSHLIYLLKPFYMNLGSRILKSPKLYFMDAGLVGYLTGVTDKKTLFHGPQAGALFENFVIQEVVKHYLFSGREPRLFYYRNNHGLEVDLLIEEKFGSLRPCEVKLSRSPHAGMLNSIERLKKLNQKIIMDGDSLIGPRETVQALGHGAIAYGVKSFLSTLPGGSNRQDF